MYDTFKELNIPGVSNKYPLLTGNRNEMIRYYYSPSGQLNLSIFNLDSHALHLKIVYQTTEISFCSYFQSKGGGGTLLRHPVLINSSKYQNTLCLLRVNSTCLVCTTININELKKTGNKTVQLNQNIAC